MNEKIEEKPIKIRDKSVRNEKGQFVKGNPSIGSGRPKGSISIITAAKKVLREHPERLGEIVEDLLTNEKLRLELIRQIDGMPKQRQEIQADIKSKIELDEGQFEQLVGGIIRDRQERPNSKEAGEGKTD